MQHFKKEKSNLFRFDGKHGPRGPKGFFGVKETAGNAGRNPKAPRVSSQTRVMVRCASLVSCKRQRL